MPIPHDLRMVQIRIFFFWELVLGQNRKHVNVRQVVVLRLLYRSRHDTRCVVNKPIHEELVKGLLHFDEDRAAGFCCPIDIKYCGFIVQNAGILLDSERECLDGVFAFEFQHCVQELYCTLWFRFVCHKHLENAVGKRIDILVFLSVIRQVFRVFVNILYHGEKYFSIHKCSFD